MTTQIPLPEPAHICTLHSDEYIGYLTADQMRSLAAQVRRETLLEAAKAVSAQESKWLSIEAKGDAIDAIRALIKEEVA
jgi:hypothetical protein